MLIINVLNCINLIWWFEKDTRIVKGGDFFKLIFGIDSLSPGEKGNEIYVTKMF